MKTSNLHPVASSAGPTAEPSEVDAGPQRELPDTSRAVAVVASDRWFEALEHAWELEERRFTAAECSAMPLRRLRRLCEEAFAALDSDFPAWGARDEYEVLSAELMARARTLRNRPTSALG